MDWILGFLRGAFPAVSAGIQMTASAIGSVLYSAAVQPIIRMISTLLLVTLVAISGAVDAIASVLVSVAVGHTAEISVAQVVAWSVTTANSIGLIDGLQWFLWMLSPVISSAEVAIIVAVYAFAIPLAITIHIAMWIVSFGGGAGTR